MRLEFISYNSKSKSLPWKFRIHGISKFAIYYLTNNCRVKYEEVLDTLDDAPIIFPCRDYIDNDQEISDIISSHVRSVHSNYKKLVVKLTKLFIDQGMDDESAISEATRQAEYLLPVGTSTTIDFSTDTDTLFDLIGKIQNQDIPSEVKLILEELSVVVDKVISKVIFDQ